MNEFRRSRPSGIDFAEEFRLVADLTVSRLMVLDVVDAVASGELPLSEVTGADFTTCHLIADQAVAAGCGGLLVPAAGAGGFTNVVVFPTHLDHLTVVTEQVMTAAELLGLADMP